MREWPLNQPAAMRVEAKDLGWLGAARNFRVAGMTPRLARAIAERAHALGISDVDGLPDGPQLAVFTETPAQHQAADRLIAYVEGMSDVLGDEYGRQDEPVEVRRADLSAVLAQFGNGSYHLAPLMEAVGRLRGVLGKTEP